MPTFRHATQPCIPLELVEQYILTHDTHARTHARTQALTLSSSGSATCATVPLANGLDHHESAAYFRCAVPASVAHGSTMAHREEDEYPHRPSDDADDDAQAIEHDPQR